MFWILLGVLAVGLFYWRLIRPHSYWKNKGVKQGFVVPIVGENWSSFAQTKSFAAMVQDVYTRFPGERLSGVYQFMQPILVVRDPDLIRQLTVKDFDHFTDHDPFIPEGQEPLWNSNVFALRGEKWRHMRATLSPAFTSSKMRAMFELMNQSGEQFTNHFLKKNEDVVNVEMKDTFTRFTNDVIATCAFGIKCDSLEERENEFYLMGKEATDFTGFWKNMKLVLFYLSPALSKILELRFFSKSVSKFFTNLVDDTVKMREETKLVRPDMIHLLMEARKGKLRYEEEQASSKETGFATVEESSIGTSTKIPKQEITLEDMTAQALIFFFAGFDSVSTLLCFMSHELAVNPDIQQRLIEEVDETMNNCKGKLTYDAVNKMKYLDMVIAETLRKWPAGIMVDRVCVKPYTIEPKNPSETALHLVKGSSLWIPIFGLHRDPLYYPNPERFDPERFSDENKDNIKPYTYLPFGVGPRNCIGSRFALIEAKTVFVHILSRFEIVVTEKTQTPLKLCLTGFTLNAEKGFNVGLRKRCK